VLLSTGSGAYLDEVRGKEGGRAEWLAHSGCATSVPACQAGGSLYGRSPVTGWSNGQGAVQMTLQVLGLAGLRPAC